MHSLHLADSLIKLMEEDRDPVPLDAIEELREAVAGVRWPGLGHQEYARTLVLRLELLRAVTWPAGRN